MVSEPSNILFANVGSGELLLSEQLYRKLVLEACWPHEQGSKSRADITFLRGLKLGEVKSADALARHVTAVIEVKRGAAARANIDHDFERLTIVNGVNPDVRTLLILASETVRAKRFVTPDGKAVRRKGQCKETMLAISCGGYASPQRHSVDRNMRTTLVSSRCFTVPHGKVPHWFRGHNRHEASSGGFYGRFGVLLRARTESRTLFPDNRVVGNSFEIRYE